MTPFLETYGTTLGPLGFPQSDEAAKSLETVLDTLPEVDYRRLSAVGNPVPGDRADISWISTEALDRQAEVVLASGMDDSQFSLNPIVTLNHDYTRAPIGRSTWRRRTRRDGVVGIQARTVYPAKPDDWSGAWAPDAAFALVQAGLLAGKSIGFLAMESRPPTPDEVAQRPEMARCRRVVTRWLLLEYACTWLPVNPQTLTEAVGKGFDPGHLDTLGVQRVVPFISQEEIVSAVQRRLDLDRLIANAVARAIDRVRGRV
jgi:hypothetical protein